MELVSFITIVTLALVFDYLNGFHDAANAVATVISTKALSPRAAILYGAVLNFVGAMLGTEVAATIGKNIVNPAVVTPEVLIFSLIGAILWNLITWLKGLPTSSSHALIGSLCGATVFGSGSMATVLGWQHVKWHNLYADVILPMLSSPIMGFFIGYLIMLGLIWLLRGVHLFFIKFSFSKMQILSSGFLALSHGSNDAQKSMGIIALAMSLIYATPFHVAVWVKIACALAMGLGTLSGGWKIIRTLGSKMIKLQPVNGFAAEITSGSIILTASHFGLPISTTQVISSAIMGVGATKRVSAVKWGIVSNIIWAWILTIPLTFMLSGSLYWIYNRIIH